MVREGQWRKFWAKHLVLCLRKGSTTECGRTIVSPLRSHFLIHGEADTGHRLHAAREWTSSADGDPVLVVAGTGMKSYGGARGAVEMGTSRCDDPMGEMISAGEILLTENVFLTLILMKLAPFDY